MVPAPGQGCLAIQCRADDDGRSALLDCSITRRRASGPGRRTRPDVAARRRLRAARSARLRRDRGDASAWPRASRSPDGDRRPAARPPRRARPGERVADDRAASCASRRRRSRSWPSARGQPSVTARAAARAHGPGDAAGRSVGVTGQRPRPLGRARDRRAGDPDRAGRSAAPPSPRRCATWRRGVRVDRADQPGHGRDADDRLAAAARRPREGRRDRRGHRGGVRRWARRDPDLRAARRSPPTGSRARSPAARAACCARAPTSPPRASRMRSPRRDGRRPGSTPTARRMPRSLPAEARDALRAGEVDAVTFTSASTVRGFVGALGDGQGRPEGRCIGPVTAREARAHGLTVHAVARPHTIEAWSRRWSECSRRAAADARPRRRAAPGGCCRRRASRSAHRRSRARTSHRITFGNSLGFSRPSTWSTAVPGHLAGVQRAA